MFVIIITTGVCEKTFLRIRRLVGKTALTALQFLLLGRMAKARAKGVFLFTDTGVMHDTEREREIEREIYIIHWPLNG